MLIVVAPHDGPKLADSIAFLKHNIDPGKPAAEVSQT